MVVKREAHMGEMLHQAECGVQEPLADQTTYGPAKADLRVLYCKL